MISELNQQDLIPFDESIGQRLLDAFEHNSTRLALNVGGINYRYLDLMARSYLLAAFINQLDGATCAILGNRNINTYTSIVATLIAGKAYLPLNNRDSADKNSEKLLLTKTAIIIADDNHVSMIKMIAKDISHKLWVIFPTLDATPHALKTYRHLHCANRQDFTFKYLPKVYSYRYAYILFTSGSTGKPKAIRSSHQNLHAYLDNFIEHCSPTKEDRFSQLHDLSFDFSIHELFVPLSIGASLHVLQESALLRLPVQLNELKISFFAVIPSMLEVLIRSCTGHEVSLLRLRHTMFCGEVLPDTVARFWSTVAPYSIIDNFYGPAESTVAVMRYRWQVDNQMTMVPIGHPWKNCQIKLLDPLRNEVAHGMIGEIWLAGPQLITGYHENASETRRHFHTLIDNTKAVGQRFYRTGDLAYFDSVKGFIFKGRSDEQFKIRGRRVEKVEIEQEIKTILPSVPVAIIHIHASGAVGGPCIVFVVGDLDVRMKMTRQLNQHLPGYYLPILLYCIPYLPRSPSGKVNYPILKRSYALWRRLCNKTEDKNASELGHMAAMQALTASKDG